MKSLLMIGGLFFALAAQADSFTLSPGPGYPTYLGASCGGVQTVVGADAIAPDLSSADIDLSASTHCSTGGRGARSRYYKACWQVTFVPQTAYLADGTSVLIWTIATRTRTASFSWLQGQPHGNCGPDPTAVITVVDPNDSTITLATLSSVGNVGLLDIPDPSLVPVTGPAAFAVPSLLDLDETDARAAIEAAGLVPYVTYYYTVGGTGLVFNQSPAAGTILTEGEQVHVYVSKPIDSDD